MKSLSFGILIGLFLMALCNKFAIQPYRVDKSPANSHREFMAVAQCLQDGQLVEAQNHLNHVIVNHNGDLIGWGIWVAQGEIYYRQGNIPGAKAAFKEALRLNPGCEPAQKGIEKVRQVQKYEMIQIKTK